MADETRTLHHRISGRRLVRYRDEAQRLQRAATLNEPAHFAERQHLRREEAVRDRGVVGRRDRCQQALPSGIEMVAHGGDLVFVAQSGPGAGRILSRR